MSSPIPTLSDLYLLAIAAMATEEKLSCAVNQITDTKGALYLLRDGSTAAEAVIAFEFYPDRVVLQAVLRNEVVVQTACTYVEGVDRFVLSMMKALRANRLVAPRSKAA